MNVSRGSLRTGQTEGLYSVRSGGRPGAVGATWKDGKPIDSQEEHWHYHARTRMPFTISWLASADRASTLFGTHGPMCLVRTSRNQTLRGATLKPPRCSPARFATFKACLMRRPEADSRVTRINGGLLWWVPPGHGPRIWTRDKRSRKVISTFWRQLPRSSSTSTPRPAPPHRPCTLSHCVRNASSGWHSSKRPGCPLHSRLALADNFQHILWLIEHAGMFGVARVAGAGQAALGGITLAAPQVPGKHLDRWKKKLNTLGGTLLLLAYLTDITEHAIDSGQHIFGMLT